MRYNTPVVFVKKEDKVYDPDSGIWKWDETRTKKYANVTDMGAQRQQAVFGDVKSSRKVVRLQREYNEDFDYVEINGEKYWPDNEKLPSGRQSLVVIKDG